MEAIITSIDTVRGFVIVIRSSGDLWGFTFGAIV